MTEKDQKLVVEGPDDQHVIWALCQHHDVAETFSVETTRSGGVEALLESIKVRLMSLVFARLEWYSMRTRT